MVSIVSLPISDRREMRNPRWEPCGSAPRPLATDDCLSSKGTVPAEESRARSLCLEAFPVQEALVVSRDTAGLS